MNSIRKILMLEDIEKMLLSVVKLKQKVLYKELMKKLEKHLLLKI